MEMLENYSKVSEFHVCIIVKSPYYSKSCRGGYALCQIDLDGKSL